MSENTTETIPTADLVQPLAHDSNKTLTSVNYPSPTGNYHSGYIINIPFPLEETADVPLFNIVISPLSLPMAFLDPFDQPEVDLAQGLRRLMYAYTNPIQPVRPNGSKLTITDKAYFKHSDYERFCHRYASGDIKVSLLIGSNTGQTGRLKISTMKQITRTVPSLKLSSLTNGVFSLDPFDSWNPITYAQVQSHGFISVDLSLNRTVTIDTEGHGNLIPYDMSNFYTQLAAYFTQAAHLFDTTLTPPSTLVEAVKAIYADALSAFKWDVISVFMDGPFGGSVGNLHIIPVFDYSDVVYSSFIAFYHPFVNKSRRDPRKYYVINPLYIL